MAELQPHSPPPTYPPTHTHAQAARYQATAFISLPLDNDDWKSPETRTHTHPKTLDKSDTGGEDA